MIETRVDGTHEYTPQVLIQTKSRFGFYFPWNQKWKNINKHLVGNMEADENMRTIFKTAEEAQEFINLYNEQEAKAIGKQIMSVHYADTQPTK